MTHRPRTSDKYQRVFKDREQDKAAENEVRISGKGFIYSYISYAARLILEKNLDVIILKATGQAASVAVNVAEILKHSIAGLNQENTIKNVTVSDEYLPREEGLDKVVIKRELAVLEIRLSK
jgi:DNA-binding protein